MNLSILYGLITKEGKLQNEDVLAPKIQTIIEAEVKFINRLVDERTCGVWNKQSLELAVKSMRYESADKSTSIRRKKKQKKNEAPSVFLHPGTGIVRPPQDHTTYRRTSNEYVGLLKTTEIGCHSE